MCVGAAAQVLGCGTADDDNLAESAATVCTTVGSTWWNTAVADQTGKFHVEFDATPSGSAIDAVVGMSAGPASGYANLAAIVRFNTSGTFDARSGSSYVADYTWNYQAGVTYHIRMDVDVKAHTYSAYFRIGNSVYEPIARSIPFRTEQASVTHLANAASKLDSPGSLQVCGITVVTDATTADGCVVASAGDGFVNLSMPDATVLGTDAFYATPSTSNIDAVIGFSAGPATAFTNLATAARFYTNGYMDARDGSGYRADVQEAYSASREKPVRMIADLTSHTYSVFLGTADEVELARQYRFRTEQASVTHLDHIAMKVDSSTGSITLCPGLGPSASSGVRYSREGTWTVAPVSAGAVVSDGTTTQQIDSRGAVLGSVSRGGRVAVDAIGNVYLARAASGTLTLEGLNPSLVRLWLTTIDVPSDARITAFTVDGSGNLVVGFVSSSVGRVFADYFSDSGTYVHGSATAGSAIALDGDSIIVAYDDRQGNFYIAKYAEDGSGLWLRHFTGSADVTTMAAVPDGGVVFGGELVSPTDFGGGTLPTYFNENGGDNGFVARFDGSGTHVFSQRTGYAYVNSVASNGQRIVVSGTERTQFYYPKLDVLDMTGAPASLSFDSGFGEHGRGYDAFIAPDGRIWWNTETQWSVAGASYLLAL